MKQLILSFAIASLLFASCKKDEMVVAAGKTTLTFDAKVGTADFALNKNFTIGTDTFNFSQLRYWVSNIVLTKEDGSTYQEPNSFYLIEETNAVPTQEGSYTYPAKKREDVMLSNIPAGNYKSISFSVGVDADHNNNLSLQGGELSQLSGMTNISWMWHTSYIFSSLKGTFAASGATSRKNIVVETGLNANYKTVTLNLPASLATNGTAANSIAINVDVTKIIDGLTLNTAPTVNASTPTTMTLVANNYSSKVFSVMSAK